MSRSGADAECLSGDLVAGRSAEECDEICHLLRLDHFTQRHPRHGLLAELFHRDALGSGDIQEWTVPSALGFTFSRSSWKPRLGLKANITSGDRDPRSIDLQTFNPLFPRGAYFGEPALIGPVNLVDIHPSLSLKPAAGFTLQVDWIRFWRQSRGDGCLSWGKYV